MYDGGTNESDVDWVVTTKGKDKTFKTARGKIECFIRQVKGKWRRFQTAQRLNMKDHAAVAEYNQRLMVGMILHHLNGLAERDMFRRKNLPEPNNILSIF